MFTLNNGSLLRTLQLSVKVKEAINPKQTYESKCRTFPDVLPFDSKILEPTQEEIELYNKCLTSPYWFYITYYNPADTRYTEESFNKEFERLSRKAHERKFNNYLTNNKII